MAYVDMRPATESATHSPRPSIHVPKFVTRKNSVDDAAPTPAPRRTTDRRERVRRMTSEPTATASQAPHTYRKITECEPRRTSPIATVTRGTATATGRGSRIAETTASTVTSSTPGARKVLRLRSRHATEATATSATTAYLRTVDMTPPRA